jgi:serine/threonine protein kinase
MHSRGVYHRDVKTENLRVADDTVKFIDFGISKLYEGKGQHLHTKNVVTRCYRPPEIFFGQRDYDLAAVDVWSAGCTIAEIFIGEVLFPGTSDIEQLSLIFEVLGTPSVEDWPEVESLPCYLPFSDQPLSKLDQVISSKAR